MTLIGKQTEDGFLRTVLLFSKLYNWKSAHFRPAKTDRGWKTPVQGDGKGFPDLILVRGPEHKIRMVVAELKVGKNKPSPEQEDWLAAFKSSCEHTYLWRPENWDEIERVLGS